MSSSITILSSAIVEPSTWERKPGYRSVLVTICRRGLLAGGILSILGLALYLVTHLVILGKTPVWIRLEPGANPELLVMWDKLLVFVFGLVMLWVYRARAELEWGRLIPAVIVVLLAAVSVFDEVRGANDITSGAVYPTMYLLVAAVAIPYRPLQMLTLTGVTFAVVVGAEAWFPTLLDVSIKGEIVRQMPYMCLVTALLTGLTVLISGTRYDQYLARTEAEHLAAELEAQARSLEEARNQTEQQAAQLVEAERLKDRFFGNISHEFRSPLTLILGPVRDALNGSLGELRPAVSDMLSTVAENGGRLLTLVNDLLELSRLDANRVRLHVEEHDFVPFLNTVFHHFVDEARRNKIQYTYHSTFEYLPLSFDPGAVEKVVHNLLNNAFKFVPDGGAVKLTLSTEEDENGQWAKVSVKDNGTGIPQDQLQLIWDRFHRIEHEGLSEGTGIGLALVKELTELHGGRVAVTSEPGFGAEFSVSLPVTAQFEIPREVQQQLETQVIDDIDPADYAGLDDLPPVDTRNAPIVLVVDDDPGIQAYVRSVLESTYRVNEAEDGIQALESIGQNRPALVISDVMMPRMDGFELCRKIKSDSDLSDLPVVLLTALADEEHLVRGLKSRADDYIPKPFHSPELLARVENLIELRIMLSVRPGIEYPRPTPVDVPSVDEAFMKRVDEVIEEHMGNSNFGVEWLADEVGLSARQLQRRIRDITRGRYSAGSYLRLMRLERAKQLLSRRAGNVSEVAFKVGFRDPAYFSRLFKQTVGCLPSEYMARVASEDGQYTGEVLSGLQEEDDADGGDDGGDDAGKDHASQL
jgi:signal transduction histidine kinase/AraC-like DNA-binding protein